MVRERGSGITPPRVVQLLREFVSKNSILAVSRSAGLGLAAIDRYLKGIGEPTTATLQKLATFFGVSVAWLRGGNIGPLERFLEGIRTIGINKHTYNETVAARMGKEGDYWQTMIAGNAAMDSEQLEVLCNFFGINEYWVTTGKAPPLLFSGGFVGTVTVSPDKEVTRFLTRSDPCAGGDHPPGAEDIANWLRKDPELRKMVDKLLADDPPDSKKD